MAEHVDNIAALPVPFVSKNEFYSRARTGDLVLCSGSAEISKIIEGEIKSPFSHVIQLWLQNPVWLTIESTFDKGTHVGLFRNYMDSYEGTLVLCKRPCLSPTDIINIRTRLLEALGDDYDWLEEVSIAAHNIVSALPILIPKKEYYCSGYQYYGSLAASPALQRPGKEMPTPEDVWTDKTVVADCAYKPEGASAPSFLAGDL